MQYIISGLIMLVIDIIYLSLTGHEFKGMVKKIQKSSFAIRMSGAIVSYILMILGLNTFIIREKGSPMDAAILGLVIYGVFDAVNYAIFSKYDLLIALKDTFWGATLFYMTTYLTYKIN
jgi:uncharacterized membrane protein